MTSEAGVVLELRGVAVGVGPRVLMRGLSLGVRAGELVALRAPSGAGKTRLLRAVAGLDDLSEGEILLRGQSPDATGWPRWRRSVVLCAQRAPALPGSVRDNLARPFEYASASSSFPEGRARELIARLLLGPEVFEQRAETLSEGELQRVGLIRSLLLEPAVLLLDEPTSALDEEATRAVEELVREVVGRGTCALVVTHDPAQAERWCDRSVALPVVESVGA